MSGRETPSKLPKSLQIFLAVFAVFLTVLTVVVVLANDHFNRPIFHVNFFALLTGLILEYKLVTKKWSTVLWTAIGSFFLGLFFLMLLQGEIELWPYLYVLAFIIIGLVLNYSNLKMEISEGTALLFSVAITYWIFGNGYLSDWSALQLGIILSFLLLPGFSIYHALSYRPLGDRSKLILSLWTSVISLILSFDNILRLSDTDLGDQYSFSTTFLFLLQYFLLGISSIYIARNVTMIAAYMPSKGDSVSEYRSRVRGMNKIHIDRVADEQALISDSLIALIISVTAFSLNYFYHFLPVNMMIWLSISLIMVLLSIIHQLRRRRNIGQTIS